MSYFSWQRLARWTVLAAIPTFLHAADGVILIDQNSAVAGGVVPGDEPGFPVTITQPGSYRLSGNLTVPDANTTAIRITADSVTLDLGGFSIAGPIVCSGDPTSCSHGQGVGIQATGADAASAPRGVTILNGSVHGMDIGVWMTGDGAMVKRVAAYSNATGGMTVSGSVLESSSTRNGGFGIIGNMVRDSNTSLNGGEGIILNPGGVASSNVVSLNNGMGIVAPYATVTSNSLFANKLAGISAICPSTIVGNTIATLSDSLFDLQGGGCVQSNNAAGK